ncbi:MAG: hypothetical protein E6G76_07200 [Alphaproteobacteria bacterium]|nr:MAG: hypothetical protein E6G76_07200 [Alphaproteobacteria bacterium]
MPEPPFSIIHVGFARTGTTSLQLNFFSHRDDIFYVGEPYGKFGGIFSHLRFTEDFKYDEVYLLRLCNEQIFAKTEGRPIVISDEILCDSPQRYLVPYLVPRDVIAFRLFKFFQPARIIFTIRKQEDYVSSVYLNLKRNSAFLDRITVPPLSRWYRAMVSQLRGNFLQNIDFHESIALYEQIFGRENILVLPLERLIIDGPDRYLQELCDFIGIELSEQDVHRFAQPQNVRMSEVQNLAAELLSDDDRFFSFFSRLEQSFGRERVREFLEFGERTKASLESDDLADLKGRVGAGNRRLAEDYGLELERFGYTLAAASPSRTPAIQTAPTTGQPSENRLTQLQGVIDTQRRAHANQIGDIEATFDAQRQVFRARIQDLEATLDRERNGFAAQFRDLEAVLQREREGFGARIEELDATVHNERAAFAAEFTQSGATHQREREVFLARIGELDTTLAAERDAFRARIGELETTLGAEREAFLARVREVETRLHEEREAFLARIRELDTTVENERSAFSDQFAAMRVTVDAERQAYIARIQEFEAVFQAEREAFVARIGELDRALQRLGKFFRWVGLSPLLALRQRLTRKG